MKTISIIAYILTIVGALNWLLVGLFGFNLVATIFGSATFMSNLIYILVGIAGLWLIFFIFMYQPFSRVSR
jgi:uncharacterized membrane protein YuzA (DUF378 family)